MRDQFCLVWQWKSESRSHLRVARASSVILSTSYLVRLFVSTRSGGPLDDDDIVRIVAKAVNRAGIRKHVTPHTLRHYSEFRTITG